jgi:hypothetical protein
MVQISLSPSHLLPFQNCAIGVQGPRIFINVKKAELCILFYSIRVFLPFFLSLFFFLLCILLSIIPFYIHLPSDHFTLCLFHSIEYSLQIIKYMFTVLLYTKFNWIKDL